MLEFEDFVAHGVHVDEHEIDRLAEAGTSVIHCPGSNMKLASGMAPVQRMVEAGVNVGLGTDGAAANNDLSMLGEGHDATMLGKLAADDASAVPAELVVELMTRGSATAIGLDSGWIKEGAPADLAVIDLKQPHPASPVNRPCSSARTVIPPGRRLTVTTGATSAVSCTVWILEFDELCDPDTGDPVSGNGVRAS